MKLDYFLTGAAEDNPLIPIAYEFLEGLFLFTEKPFFNKKVDSMSKGHTVEKPLKCAISSCFDKYNICCKACDIKKCRYKCNFIDKEVCEYQIT